MHVLPDKKMLTKGKVEMNGMSLPVFQIEVISKDESNKQHLEFAWEVIEMNEWEIKS